MRRPLHLTHRLPKTSQQGYALFIVLMIMIVVALLVVAAIQSYNTEQRISTNDADRKLASSLAEAALREGENTILNFEEKKVTFAADCNGKILVTKTNNETQTSEETQTKGLCAAPNISVPAAYKDNIVVESATGNAWEREDKNKTLYIDSNGAEANLTAAGVTKKPKYIIEYISSDTTQGSTVYRVTAKAWGRNKNTVVMLQSYVANE